MDYISRLDFQINRLGYRFNDVDLLSEALTHGLSSLNSDFPTKNRTLDRLSAVGNSVLKFVISQYVIQVSGFVDEGVLDDKKQLLINKTTQTEVGRKLICPDGKENSETINKIVRIHSGNWKSGTFKVPYHQFVKAILGAVFIDAGGTSGNGIENSMDVFLKLWKGFIDENLDELKDLTSCFGTDKISSTSQYKTELEEVFNVEIGNVNFLAEALMHKSYHGCNDLPHYERLEFLGDSVLELVIVEFVFQNYANFSSHGIDCQKKKYVTDERLDEIASQFSIERLVMKGPGVDVSNKYCNIMEAVIGAIYVDGGRTRAKEFILREWELVLAENPKPSLNDLECKLGYRFKDKNLLEEALTHNSVQNLESSKKRFQHFIDKGRGLIQFFTMDYVIRTSKENAKYGAMEAQFLFLCGEKLVRSIAGYLQLNKLVKISESLTTLKSPFIRYEIFVFSIFGAIFDSAGINAMPTTAEIFYRIWNPYLKHCPKQTLLECFSLNSEGQLQLREKLGSLIPEQVYPKIEENLGGHKFKHRCLLEQALTERESRFYATNTNVGDSTKFELIGEFIVELLECWNGLVHNELDVWLLQNQKKWVGPAQAWEESLNYELLKKYYNIPPDWELMDVSTESVFHGTIGAIYVDTPGGWVEKINEVYKMYLNCITRLKKDCESQSQKQHLKKLEKRVQTQKTTPVVKRSVGLPSSKEFEIGFESRSTKKSDRIPTGIVNPFPPSKEVISQSISSQRANPTQLSKPILERKSESTRRSVYAPNVETGGHCAQSCLAGNTISSPKVATTSNSQSSTTYSRAQIMEESSEIKLPEPYGVLWEIYFEHVSTNAMTDAEKEKLWIACVKLYNTEVISRSSKSELTSTSYSVPETSFSPLKNSRTVDRERLTVESATYRNLTSSCKTQSSTSTYPSAFSSNFTSSKAQPSSTYTTAVPNSLSSKPSSLSTTYQTAVSYKNIPTEYGSAKQTSYPTSNYLKAQPTASTSINKPSQFQSNLSSTSEDIRRKQQEQQRCAVSEYNTFKPIQSSYNFTTANSNRITSNNTYGLATKRRWQDHERVDDRYHKHRQNNENSSNNQQDKNLSSIRSLNREPIRFTEILISIFYIINWMFILTVAEWLLLLLWVQ